MIQLFQFALKFCFSVDEERTFRRVKKTKKNWKAFLDWRERQDGQIEKQVKVEHLKVKRATMNLTAEINEMKKMTMMMKKKKKMMMMME